MPVEAPIACSLSAAGLPRRLAAARDLGARALIGVEAGDRAALLRFSGDREGVEAFVAAERECCSFLEFELVGAGAASDVEVRAPEGGEPSLRGLVAAVVSGWEGGL